MDKNSHKYVMRSTGSSINLSCAFSALLLSTCEPGLAMPGHSIVGPHGMDLVLAMKDTEPGAHSIPPDNNSRKTKTPVGELEERDKKMLSEHK